MESPEILIGIPTLNGPERLERCLRSIKRWTQLEKHGAQVVISDDFSYEKKLAENKTVCNAYRVPLLMATERVGVAEQWNRLVRHTDAPIQILMNDDVEVVEHWLEALVYSIRENPHAGMIGLKAYQGVNSTNFSPPPSVSYAESVMERGSGLLSSCGYLFTFLKEKWLDIGGFDTQFFAFYEEVDFGIRLFRRNSPSYMLSYPIVIHQGGATTSDPGNIDAQRVINESREKFRSKHPPISVIREQMNEAESRWPVPKCWNTGLLATIDG
jgi:GT2 family glycosyltransferase